MSLYYVGGEMSSLLLYRLCSIGLPVSYLAPPSALDGGARLALGQVAHLALVVHRTQLPVGLIRIGDVDSYHAEHEAGEDDGGDDGFDCLTHACIIAPPPSIYKHKA